jgi:hypothetical protein
MDTPYAAGIVGSRRRNTLTDRKIVFRLVDWLVARHGAEGLSIVSGACSQGADLYAFEAAKLHEPKLVMVEFPIDKKGIDNRWEFTKRAYERNRQVAERSTGLYALVATDRLGGTENTIKYMAELKKPIYLVTTSGEIYLSEDGMKRCDLVQRLLG